MSKWIDNIPKKDEAALNMSFRHLKEWGYVDIVTVADLKRFLDLFPDSTKVWGVGGGSIGVSVNEYENVLWFE